MSIAGDYAHDWFSLPPRCRTKAQLANVIDAACLVRLQELARHIREFEVNAIEDGLKLPASFAPLAIEARVILETK